MTVDLDKFMEEAKELAEWAEQGKRIVEAARTGKVQTPRYDPQEDGEYWDELRDVCKSALYRWWNEKAVPLPISLATREAQSFIRELMDAGKEEGDEKLYWRWGLRSGESFSLTVRRRFNELADSKLHRDPAPAINLKRGKDSLYLPNPFYLDDKARRLIEAQIR